MATTNEDFITVKQFDGSNSNYNGNITIIPTDSGYANYQGTVNNIVINNTFRVPKTDEGEPVPVPGLIPYMELKDQATGEFAKIEINDGDTFVGGNQLIRVDELENIINDLPVIFSNVYIDAFNPGNSYINFLTSEGNTNVPPQIGFRVSNGYIEYLHQGEGWAKVGSTTETFPTEMYLVTPATLQKSVPVPTDCVGVRLKVVGGGGNGGNPALGLFSQGAGGGSGGFVDCFLTEDDILNCSNIEVSFQSSIAPYGSNVSVFMKRQTLPTPTYISVANATGGFPGSSVISPPIGSIDGGIGGIGNYTYVTAKQGYTIPGGTGETGFWSEPQNLRYYSGGVGADSQLGTGGTGASTTAPAGTAYYGGGGGGGLFVPQGMFNPPTANIPASNISYPGGTGGDPAVLIEFWINAEPWNSNTGGGGSGNASVYFRNLLDVSVSNIATNKYVKYINQLAVNQSLDIIDDTTPQLGGNLDLNGSNIIFPNSNSGLKDSTGNLAVVIDSSNSGNCYLVLKASHLPSGEDAGEITVDSQLGALDQDVSLAINSKGNGDIQISSGTTGVIQLSGGQMSIDNTQVVEITSGHITYATRYWYDSDLSTNSLSPTTINADLASNFEVFELNQSDQRYYVTLSNGAPGQVVNLIYDCSSPNTEVRVGFNQFVGVGSGLASGLKFGISGQSSQLAYIEMSSNQSRNRWQVLNSGAYVEELP